MPALLTLNPARSTSRAVRPSYTHGINKTSWRAWKQQGIRSTNPARPHIVHPTPCSQYQAPLAPEQALAPSFEPEPTLSKREGLPPKWERGVDEPEPLRGLAALETVGWAAMRSCRRPTKELLGQFFAFYYY